MNPSGDSKLLSAALDYARRGWAVLPLHSAGPGGCSCRRRKCASAGKHPRTRRGVKNATTDEETIRLWWYRWPNANVGIATGKKSGLVVLDVDPRHGGDESLRELFSGRGTIPKTPTVKTGGGGLHLYFEHPGERVKGRVGVMPGLDVRADGNYVVAPPSLHVCGEVYSWDPERPYRT